jgi:hypothetical protein
MTMTYKLDQNANCTAWIEKSGTHYSVKINSKELTNKPLRAQPTVREALVEALQYGVKGVYSVAKCDWYTQTQIDKLLGQE